MKIIIVGSYPPPFGGQSVHIKNISKFLWLKQISYTVFNTGSDKSIIDNNVINIKSTIDLFKKLWNQKLSTIHLHVGLLGHLGSLFVCGLYSLILRRKLIITLHSGGFKKDYDSHGVVKKYILRKIFKSANAIIAVNENIKQNLESFHIQSNKIFIIPAFSLDIDLSNEKLKPYLYGFIEQHTPNITCMGFFEPHYGFELAVEAIKELKQKYPKIGLIIMASGDGKIKLEKTIEQIAIKENVLLVGNESREQYLLALSKSDIFIRPTYFDGDAISIREALAFKKKVIASQTEYRPEGVELFEIGNKKELVKTIDNYVKQKNSSQLEILKVDDFKNLELIIDCYNYIG